MTLQALQFWEFVVLAGLTTCLVVLLYFLKIWRRQVVVSSARLWLDLPSKSTPRSLFENWRHLLSFLVAVIVSLMMVLAYGDPKVTSFYQQGRRIAIVMDTSPSMFTRTADGHLRWEHAVERIQQLLTDRGSTSEYWVTTLSGERIPLDAAGPERAISLLRLQEPQVYAQFPEIDFDFTELYVVSDGVALSKIPEQARWISVFERVPNAGISLFRARPKADRTDWEAYVEVESDAPQAKPMELTISNGAQSLRRRFDIGSSAPYRGVVDLSSFSGGAIRATLEYAGEDATALDDVAYDYLPVKRSLRVLLVSAGNPHLDKALRADPTLEVEVVSPRSFRDTHPSDVYVFDRFTPELPPTRPSLIIGSPGGSWLPVVGAAVWNPRVAYWNPLHPLMQSVSMNDVRIDRADQIDPGDEEVVAGDDTLPLIVASARPPKRVRLTFSLSESDFSIQLAFPIFMRNTLHWLAEEGPTVYAHPGWVGVAVERAQVLDQDGQHVPTSWVSGQTFFNAGKPGLYLAESRNDRRYVAINATRAYLTDINVQRLTERPYSTSSADDRSWNHRFWWYLVMAVLVLLSGEWWSYHWKITV